MVAKSHSIPPPPPPPPIGIGVDNQLADRALRALLKHVQSSVSLGGGDKGKLQLLENDSDIQVQFSLTRVPGNASPKPIRIEIPHALVKVAAPSLDANDDDDGTNDNLRDVEACIIVKEESKPWVQDMVVRFPNELGCIKKVLGLQSLRVKHKTFAQRRELLARFDVFFADDRILPMLTKALGGKFFEKKKQPIAVKLTRKEALPFAIQKSLSSTFMFLSSGTCVTVKAGNTAMAPSKLLANIQAICTIVPTKVPQKWSNVRSISIKTTDSVALPIYNKTPEELEQIRTLAKDERRSTLEEKGREHKEKEEDNRKGKDKDIASTPLAKALKRQQQVKEKDVEDLTGSSNNKKKRVVEEITASTVDGRDKSESPLKKKKKEKKHNKSIDQNVSEKASSTKTPKPSNMGGGGDRDQTIITADYEKELIKSEKVSKISKLKRRMRQKAQAISMMRRKRR